MNLKKKIRGFFTLTRKADGGFTLVELIVVIAILAILAGIGVPAYSAYVTKANKQADISLVGDVAHAMQLYYYKNSTKGVAGYVLLKNGADAEADEIGTAAMEMTFGSSWATTATLKHADWTDNGMLEMVADMHDAGELKNIAGSSFMANSDSNGIMNAVTNMTNLVGGVIAARTEEGGIDEAIGHLNNLLGTGNAISAQLTQMKGTDAESKYSTVVSNMLVSHMTDAIAASDSNGLQGILNMYACAFAYSEKTNNTAALEKMNARLATMTIEELSGDEGMGLMLGAMYDEGTGVAQPGCEGFVEHFDAIGMSGQFEKDNLALVDMMDAVKSITAQFNDLDHLTDPQLYASGEVAEEVKNYMSAVKALAGLSEDARATLDKLEDGTILVAVTADGTVSVLPSAAWAAGN